MNRLFFKRGNAASIKFTLYVQNLRHLTSINLRMLQFIPNFNNQKYLSHLKSHKPEETEVYSKFQ